MKVRPRKSSWAISWILALALTVSPLVAQNPPEPNSTAVEGSDDSASATAFPVVERNSTPLAAPAPAPAQPRAADELSPAGKSKWVILATIVVTGAVIAAILLLHGGKKP